MISRNNAIGTVGALALGLAITTPATAEMTVSVGGRIQVDSTYYDDDNIKLGRGTEVRRARLFAEGAIGDDWSYKSQIDFAGNDAVLKDMFIRYNGLDFGTITLGQFKQEFGLDQLTSSKYGTFIERAMVSDAFYTGRRIGVGLAGNADAWHYAASVFGQEESDSEGVNEGNGVAGRVAYGPRVGENQLHFGVSANWQDSPDSDNEWRIRARPESHQTSVRLVDTGVIADTNSITSFGGEAAWVRGPFSIQAEYQQQSVDRDGGSDPDFTGWYAYASWFVGGDTGRSYKNGSFGRTKATNAWELAVRYSNLDLNDSGINGGKENNITAAVNYYVNPYLRFMLNGVFIDAQDTPVLGGTEDDKPTAIILRAAMDFK